MPEKDRLDCLVFSAAGANLAGRLCEKLRAAGESGCVLRAPRALWQRLGRPAELAPFSDLNEIVGELWRGASALVFVGACGIAVRAVAPFLRHKSVDPAVIVVDAAGNFAISLLSGHWGGANRLCKQLANLLGAQAVVTTASGNGAFALDLHLQKSGLKILDWRQLPRLQARMLEGGEIRVFDPWRALDAGPGLRRVGGAAGAAPDVIVHWKLIPAREDALRAVLPCLHVGVGFRKNVGLAELASGLKTALAGLEPAAVASLATVREKAEIISELARKLGCQARIYVAPELAALKTPNPSRSCGARFNLPPFSVCEASALLSARRDSPKAFLLRPKNILDGTMTFAVALAPPGKK